MGGSPVATASVISCNVARGPRLGLGRPAMTSPIAGSPQHWMSFDSRWLRHKRAPIPNETRWKTTCLSARPPKKTDRPPHRSDGAHTDTDPLTVTCNADICPLNPPHPHRPRAPKNRNACHSNLLSKFRAAIHRRLQAPAPHMKGGGGGAPPSTAPAEETARPGRLGKRCRPPEAAGLGKDPRRAKTAHPSVPTDTDSDTETGDRHRDGHRHRHRLA